MALDLSCIKKLRKDFENDEDIDISNIEGIKTHKQEGSRSKLGQAIGCFNDFIVKWDPANWQFEVSSSKLFPSTQHKDLQKQLQEVAQSTEEKTKKMIRDHPSDKIEWQPPVQWMKKYIAKPSSDNDMPV